MTGWWPSVAADRQPEPVSGAATVARPAAADLAGHLETTLCPFIEKQ